MIAVIADDFTGAAEIGGLGIRHGLSVKIETEVIPDLEADLLVVATDTRSMSNEQAYMEVMNITSTLLNKGVDWIYKKNDSVLRGHVVKELSAQLKAADKDKALLVPANPALGRTVVDGFYFVNGKPLNETDFAEDPEFSLTSSSIKDLLGSCDEYKVRINKRGEEVGDGTITLGEATDSGDLNYWAEQVNSRIIPAGAAAFFGALLKAKGYKELTNGVEPDCELGRKMLIVCGSSFAKSRQVIINAKLRGETVCEMPLKVFENDDEKFLNKWNEQIIERYQSSDKIFLVINRPIVSDDGFAKRLRLKFSLLVNNLLEKVGVDELIIEGGATASSILHKANLTSFLPQQELAPGVIRMNVIDKPGLNIIMKPGSYAWPNCIWN